MAVPVLCCDQIPQPVDIIELYLKEPLSNPSHGNGVSLFGDSFASLSEVDDRR
jgi:hypothetical protein